MTGQNDTQLETVTAHTCIKYLSCGQEMAYYG